MSRRTPWTHTYLPPDRYDPNTGQTDDLAALAVLTDVLAAWTNSSGNGFDAGAAATDLLVELPRRGWHLQRIPADVAPYTIERSRPITIADVEELVDGEWRPATGDELVIGALYRPKPGLVEHPAPFRIAERRGTPSEQTAVRTAVTDDDGAAD